MEQLRQILYVYGNRISGIHVYTRITHLTSIRQYRAKDRPWYRLGHGIVILYIAIGLLCSIAFAVFLRRENARRDRGERDEVIKGIANNQAHERNGVFESVEDAKAFKGDYWSGFRYTL